jgi:hypothetical protein
MTGQKKIDRSVLIGHTKEIEEVMFKVHPDVISDEGLFTANRKRNEELTELLRQQKRALDFMEGKPLEPEIHFAEAVIIGKIEGSTP